MSVMIKQDALLPTPRHGSAETRIAAYVMLGNLVFALTVAGFPIAAGVSQLLGLADNRISIIFRVIHLGLCIILTAWSVRRHEFKFDVGICVFFMIYGVRLAFDYTFANFSELAERIPFFVSTVVFPSLAMAGAATWFDRQKAMWMIFWIGLVGNLIAFYALRTDPLLLQASAGVSDMRIGLSALNPISIAYNGLFTAAAAILLLARSLKRATTIVLLLAVVLSGYLMFAAGSRGPFIALALAMIVTGAAQRRLAIVYALVGTSALFLLAGTGIVDLIFDRFATAGYDASSLERTYSLSLSWQEFLENPIIGLAYVEPVTGIYPHNMLVEAGLALGLIGFVLMLVMQIRLLVSSIIIAQEGQLLLSFIAATQIVNAWISGALWASGLFFASLWLIGALRSELQVQLSAPRA